MRGFRIILLVAVNTGCPKFVEHFDITMWLKPGTNALLMTTDVYADMRLWVTIILLWLNEEGEEMNC